MIDLHKEIYRFLDNISNSTGKTITEYHWREACELIKLMEDKGLINIERPEIELDCEPENETEWM